ncbi:hypothetical protein ACFWTE_12705 [Nocardiopsis sp. NPDC058631]|uniref:hypothetical protein n=1 Tax=Nocardiopsis sp. NPDC058631 TaxID=3346566 RepID=UPI0036644B6E
MSPLPIVVSTLSVLLFVVVGLVVLVLAFAAPPGRRGLVAAAGSLIAVGALLGGLVRVAGHYAFAGFGHGGPPPFVYTLVGLVVGLVFATGLALLVVAATRRAPDTEGSPGVPPPPGSGPRPHQAS